jgi:hypothetical protein
VFLASAQMGASCMLWFAPVQTFLRQSVLFVARGQSGQGSLADNEMDTWISTGHYIC